MDIPAPIQEIQEQITQTLDLLGEDRERMLEYLIEMGTHLPPLSDRYKTPANTIKGCISTVWLVCKREGNRLFFMADSNTLITKGLVGLLVHVLSGQTIDDILKADLYFTHKINVSQLLGAQRISGQTNMVKQMKLYAMAHKVKMQQQSPTIVPPTEINS